MKKNSYHVVAWILIITQLFTPLAYSDIKTPNEVATLGTPLVSNSQAPSSESEVFQKSIKSDWELLEVLCSIGEHIFEKNGKLRTLPKKIRNKFRANSSYCDGVNLEEVKFQDGVITVPYKKSNSAYEIKLASRDLSRLPAGWMDLSSKLMAQARLIDSGRQTRGQTIPASASSWLTLPYGSGAQASVCRLASIAEVEAYDGKGLIGSQGERLKKVKILKEAYKGLIKEDPLVKEYFSAAQDGGRAGTLLVGLNIPKGESASLVLARYDNSDNTVTLEDAVLDSTGAHAEASEVLTRAQMYHEVLEDFIHPYRTEKTRETDFMADTFVLLQELEYIYASGKAAEVCAFIHDRANRIADPAAEIIENYAEIRRTAKSEPQLAEQELTLVTNYLMSLSEMNLPNRAAQQEVTVGMFIDLGERYFKKGAAILEAGRKLAEQTKRPGGYLPEVRECYRQALRQYSHALAYRPQDQTLRQYIKNTLNAYADLFSEEEVSDFNRIWNEPSSKVSELWEFMKAKLPMDELKYIPESKDDFSDRVGSFYEQLEKMVEFLDHLDCLFGDTPQVTKEQFYAFVNAKGLKGAKFSKKTIDNFIDAYDRITRYNPIRQRDTSKKVLWLSSMLLFYTRTMHGDGSMDAWQCLPNLLRKLQVKGEELEQVMSLVTMWRNFGMLFFGEGSPEYGDANFARVSEMLKKMQDTKQDGSAKYPDHIVIDKGENGALLAEFLAIIDNSPNVYEDLMRFKDDGKLVKLFPNFAELKELRKYGTTIMDHSLGHVRFLDGIGRGDNPARDILNKIKKGRIISERDYSIYHQTFKSLIDKDPRKNRRLMYIISLFHDIGESSVIRSDKFPPSTMHELKGGWLIRDVLHQMGLEALGITEGDVDMASWLVNSHVELGTIHFGERTVTKLKENIYPPASEEQKKEWVRFLCVLNLSDIYSIGNGDPLSPNKAAFFSNVLSDDSYLAREYGSDLLNVRLKIFCSDNKGNLLISKYNEANRILARWKEKYPRIYESFYRNMSDVDQLIVINYVIFFLQSLNAETMMKLLLLLSQIVDRSAKEWGNDGIKYVEFTAKSADATFSSDPIKEVFGKYSWTALMKMSGKSLAEIKEDLMAHGIRTEYMPGEKKMVFDNKQLLDKNRYVKLSSIMSAGVILSKLRNIVTDNHIKSLTFSHNLTKQPVRERLKANWVKVRVFLGFFGKDREAFDLEEASSYQEGIPDIEDVARAEAESARQKAEKDDKTAEAFLAAAKSYDDVADDLKAIKDAGDYKEFLDFMLRINVKNGIWNIRRIASYNKRAIIRLFYLLFKLKKAYETSKPNDLIDIIKFSHELDSNNTRDALVFQQLVKGLESMPIDRINELCAADPSPFRSFSVKLGLIGEGITPETENIVSVNTIFVNLKAAPDSQRRTAQEAGEARDLKGKIAKESKEAEAGFTHIGMVNAPVVTPKGSVRQGLKTFYEKFKDRPVAADEFIASRMKDTVTDTTFSETTVRMELKMLKALGIVIVDESEKKHKYMLKSEIRNLPPPVLDEILSIPELDRYEIPENKIASTGARIDSILIHQENSGIRIPLEEGKVLWHVIPVSLIPQSPDYNQQKTFIRFVNEMNRLFPDVNEKIKIVTDRQDLIEVANSLAADTNNIVDVAVSDEALIDKLSVDVRGSLVFKPEGGNAGDFRQLEGVLAGLRALHITDPAQRRDKLARLYKLLTGKDAPPIPDIIDRKFLKEFIFVLPPIEIKNKEELKGLNENLQKLIESA